jgi:undecaprenyl diphosphate synthase
MSLLVEAIHSEVPSLMENNIKLETIGDIHRLPSKSVESLHFAKEKTAKNNALTLILALNYGSKDELIHATRSIAEEVKEGVLSVEDIDEDCLNKHLYTFPYPNPDIMIRTSGEQRISNFLLWQLAYAEFFFLNKFWPDFTREDLFACIDSYHHRDRRFGAI